MNRKQKRSLEKKRREQQGKGTPKPEKIQTQIKREDLGPAGISGELHFVPITPGGKSGEEILRDKVERDFEITLYFKKDFVFSNSIKGDRKRSEGSSFVAFPKDAVWGRIYTPNMVYDSHQNSSNELSSISAIVNAKSVSDAVGFFMDNLTPTLDHFSYQMDIPFFYDELMVFDKKNMSTMLTFVSPYQHKIVYGTGQLQSKLIPIYSLFREAKNSVSPFYKILCYAKILEGLIKSLRPEVNKIARERGVEIEHRKLVVPNDPEISKFQNGQIGKPIIQLYESDLQKSYRDAIAHFELDGKAPINLSQYAEQANFARMVYLFEVCARTMIADVERCLIELDQKPAKVQQ